MKTQVAVGMYLDTGANDRVIALVPGGVLVVPTTAGSSGTLPQTVRYFSEWQLKDMGYELPLSSDESA